MSKGRSLTNMLQDHNISADEFFETQGISAQIRSNLTRFVNYCRTHRLFATRMVQLALNISPQELEDPRIRSASYAVNEVFGNEETELVELFFDQEPKPQAKVTEVSEEVVEGIQSEAERLFRFDEEEDEEAKANQPPREIQITGKELVALSLQILKNPERNETCLGYLQKMYSFFIRHDPIPVLGYFLKHPEMLQLLLKNIRYSSVSLLLAQLLTSEDKNKEYKFEGLKKGILEHVIEQIFNKMKDQCFFDGAIVFLEEILNTSKQSYYEYFEDFKRVSNYLVSGTVLKRFYDELFKLNEPSFDSTSRFLQSLFLRMKSEQEDNRYYHKEENQPTMNFEIDVFLSNVPALLLLVPQTQSFNSLTRIHYLSFLEALLSTVQAKTVPLSLTEPYFIGLFDAYRAQPFGGMCKSKTYNLINGLLSRSSEAQIKGFLEVHQQMFQQYFGTIKGANYSNTKVYNKNEAAAFDVSLIGQLTRKDENVLAIASKALGKDLKRICKKYETKIASFQNNSSPFSLEEQSNFYQYNSQNSKAAEGGSGLSLTFVGKNNISIPILHLPDRFHNLESKKRTDLEDERANELSGSPTEVFEVEEVVVLTNKLGKIPPLERMMIPQSMMEEFEPAKRETEDFCLNQVPKLAQPKICHQQVKVQPEVVKDVPKLNVLESKQRGDVEKARFFTRHLALFA